MDPVVELRIGRVRGVVEKHEDGFNYYAFKGVPYAEPPIGEMRFEDPIPKKKWTETLDCKNYGPICLQSDRVGLRESLDENCLHLNVFTHSIDKPDAKRPVMVWLNGGSFMFGAADDYYCGPDYLIRKNIVLVTVHYRIGVLGFLNLEDEIAPGNQGLKDQIMALKWVKQHIQSFSGDPKNVTIFGTSAGAVCTHYLSLSPLAKGLFHKVISHGSVVYNTWYKALNPKSTAIKLCSLLGKEMVDSKEIIAFLKTVDAKALLEAQNRLENTVDYIPFSPGIDSQSSNPVMPLDSDFVADQGVHLPYLVGHTQREGVFLLLDMSRKDFFENGDLDFNKMLKATVGLILKRYNLTEPQVRRLYYRSEKVSDKNVDNYIDMGGDIYFVEGIHRFAKVQAKHGSAPTYYYQFSYDSPNAVSKHLLTNAPTGVAHLDDVPYIFKMGILRKVGITAPKKGTQDYRVMEQITEMWTNFAAHGRPTIETSELIPVHWKPIADGTLLRYLNIDEDVTMQCTVNIEQKYLSASYIKV